jgi:hypothetical protein
VSAVSLFSETDAELPEAAEYGALVPRFPYAVVFIDLGTEVNVLAVAHAKRRPGYWLNRLAT